MKRKIIAFLLSFTVILGLFSFGCKREEKSVNSVVLVEFSDTETAFAKDDQTLLEGVFNGEESLDNFIEKNSNGNRGVESVFVGKVKIDKPIDYFMPKYEYNLFRGEYETVNEIGYDNRFLTDYGNVDLGGKQSVERFLREQKLLDLVTEKLSKYRFARGVEIENLTLIPCKLNRGVVENSLFWAHQSRVYSGSIESLSSVYYTGDKTGELSKIKLGNRSINSYIIMPYAFINSSEKVNITTLCHEYMHVLGAPDLYSYTNSSVDFVGEFDLLGNKETEIPNLSLSYIRYKMGWLDENEDIMPISKSGEYILSPAEEGQGVVAYKITLPDYYERGESFYVEYRNLGEGSLSTSNTEGLIVYRVSQTAGYTSSSGEIANSWKGNAYANEVYVYRFWREKLDGGYEERNSVTTSGICYATVGDKIGYDSFGNKNGEVNAISYSDGTNSKITVTYGGKTADGKVKFSVDIPDWKGEISSEKIVSLTGGRNLLYFDRRSENCTAYVVYRDKKIANPSASKLISGKYGEPIVLNTTFLKADLPKADGYEKYVYVCYKEGENLSKVTSHYIAGVKNIPFVIIIIIALAVGVIVPTAVLKGVKFISKKRYKNE